VCHKYLFMLYWTSFHQRSAFCV